MVAVGGVVVVVAVVGVVREVWRVEDVEGSGTSRDVQDASTDVTGEVRVVVAGAMVMSDREEKGVKAGGVGLDSGGVAWAGFDSSHRPFLQQGDSRKSDRQKDTQ